MPGTHLCRHAPRFPDSAQLVLCWAQASGRCRQPCCGAVPASAHLRSPHVGLAVLSLQKACQCN